MREADARLATSLAEMKKTMMVMVDMGDPDLKPVGSSLVIGMESPLSSHSRAPSAKKTQIKVDKASHLRGGRQAFKNSNQGSKSIHFNQGSAVDAKLLKVDLSRPKPTSKLSSKINVFKPSNSPTNQSNGSNKSGWAQQATPIPLREWTATML